MEKGNTLPLVRSVAEIQQNTATLGAYLQNTNSPESEYTKTLIRRGKCFVIVFSPNDCCFYPSRFMGYINNSMEAHEKMGKLKREAGKITKDGRRTNPAISAVLGELIKKGDGQWDKWEFKYKDFCKKLGILPDNVERKYWPPIK